MATATASRPSGPVPSIPSYRSASPTRVNLPARSPGKSVSVSSPSSTRSRRSSCMCSPTNHPGSFRCSLHKERKQAAPAGSSNSSRPASPPSPPSTSKSTGGALAWLVPMGSGHWARRALAPSPAAQQSLQHRRRAGGFRPRPSRLSAVSTAGDSQ
ncbi:zinc finger CCCH domain-containing protein 18-like [Triticum urartu]|uniref:zinc finger CCCH domain-containing protein 18-like n=1 Tax=Triticum urartu TaxID=4572 RepID=UPI00204468DA|nr:zinc finger CCCH domain-containing protein 18-like [Triticum urartu]